MPQSLDSVVCEDAAVQTDSPFKNEILAAIAGIGSFLESFRTEVTLSFNRLENRVKLVEEELLVRLVNY